MVAIIVIIRFNSEFELFKDRVYPFLFKMTQCSKMLKYGNMHEQLKVLNFITMIIIFVNIFFLINREFLIKKYIKFTKKFKLKKVH
jgi:hypothetical protein